MPRRHINYNTVPDAIFCCHFFVSSSYWFLYRGPSSCPLATKSERTLLDDVATRTKLLGHVDAPRFMSLRLRFVVAG